MLQYLQMKTEMKHKVQVTEIKQKKKTVHCKLNLNITFGNGSQYIKQTFPT